MEYLKMGLLGAYPFKGHINLEYIEKTLKNIDEKYKVILIATEKKRHFALQTVLCKYEAYLFEIMWAEKSSNNVYTDLRFVRI